MKSFFYRIFCGFFLGISVFAPGVSGSVMAVMMGIYQDLLNIVSNPLKALRKNFFYLLPMGIGGIISLVLFVLVFKFLFTTYKTATYLLFIGLVAGNLPVVFKDARADGFKPHYITGIVAAFAIAFVIGLLRLTRAEIAAADISPSLLYLGICGALTGAASMIPGMSISMLLMVFGIYDYLLMVADRLMKSIDPGNLAAMVPDLVIVALVGLCFLGAMVAFSRFTKFVFRRYHGFASFMVFGFMCGSLCCIIMGLPKNDPTFTLPMGVLMIVIGLGISALFVLLGKKLNVE